MLNNSHDVLTSVNLDILQEEMMLRMNPPSRKDTIMSSAGNGNPVPLDRVAKLEQKLDEQLQEEEKWEDLTGKLEKKVHQMATTIIRLDTSVKVFRGELMNRHQTVTSAQEHLESKREEHRRAIEKLEKDYEKQMENADNNKERAERAAEELEKLEEHEEKLTKRLKNARSGLLPLEERVHDLTINLSGNRGMSESQRIYYNAECQVEKDQRDRLLKEITTLQKDLAVVSKEVTILRGKRGLFEDEYQRRSLKAKTLEGENQELRDLFGPKLAKIEAEVESICMERDSWEEKTNKLAEDLEETKVEHSKLTVKARLFNEQLKGIGANVERLQSMIEASKNVSVTSIRVEPIKALSRVQVQEQSDDTSGSEEEESDSESDVDESESDDEDKDAYVWRPPQQKKQVATPSVQPKAPAPAPAPVKTVPSYVSPAVIKPSYASSPVVVKVNQVNVKLNPVQPGFSTKTQNKTTPSYSVGNNDSGLAVRLQNLQLDLEHQKRFQKEQAIKMEQQFARLASKVDVLATTRDKGATEQSSSTESQLNALRHQMQKDTTQDSQDIRQLLQQLGQQCSHLSKTVESLTRDAQQRERDNARMERKFQERESEYVEQMGVLRGEMDRQMGRQQQIFADRMSQAMVQMEKLVMGAGSLPRNHDSMTSLESLVPMDASSRTASGAQLNEENKVVNSGTFSMVASGIAVASPWFQK